MNVSLFEDTAAEAVMNRPVSSLLLRDDVAYFTIFYGVAKKRAYKYRLTAVKSISPLRREVYKALSEEWRQGQGKVEVPICWKHIVHRNVAISSARNYLEFLQKIKRHSRTKKDVDLQEWIDEGIVRFERLIETIPLAWN